MKGADVEQSSLVSFLDALNSHEPARLRASLDSDFEYEGVADPGEKSVAALLLELSLIVTAFPDIEFRLVRETRHEGRSYVEFRAFGTHHNEFLGISPTGSLAVFSGVFNMETNEKGIRKLTLTIDFGGLRRQLLLADRLRSR